MIHLPLSPRPIVLAAVVAALLPLTGCVSHKSPGQGWTTEVVAVADVDGDGLVDVLSATTVYDSNGFQPGYLTVRRQTPGRPGTFDDPSRTATCLDPEALAVGDVDGDGRLDVAVACGATSGSTFAVALHLGMAGLPVTFGAPTLLSTGTSRPSAVRLADLDGDGRLDLVVGVSTGNDLLVFFQAHAPATAGTFSTPVTVAIGAPPVAVAAADLTGAGRLDLVASTTNGRAVVLLHDASPGTFLPGLSYPAGLYPVAIEVADLDADGHPDLLMADGNGSLLVMTQKAGGGAFDPVVAMDSFDWETRSLAVADLDGDGRLDVAVASAGPVGLPGSVAVFLQAAAPAAPGTLQRPTLYSGYYGPMSIVAADVNGDARRDLVIADGLASIRLQSSPGQFQPPIWLRQ